MTDNANEGSAFPISSIASNSQLSRTSEGVGAEMALKCEEFGGQMERFRADPRLISTTFNKILSDLDVAHYSCEALKNGNTQLRDFIQYASALDGEFEKFPLDVKRLVRYSNSIEDYVENEWPEDGPSPSHCEEELDEYLYAMKELLLLLSTWAANQSSSDSPPHSTGDSLGAKPPMRAAEQRAGKKSAARSHSPRFAEPGADVPVRFREGGKADGKEIGPLTGSVSELMWKIAEEWTSNPDRLAQKHASHNFFVIKFSKGKFEVFFHRPEDLKVAMARDPRPDTNPKPRKHSKRSSVK